MTSLFKSKPQTFFIGLPVRTQNGEGFVSDVSPLWDNFFAKGAIDQIPNRANDEFLVVYTDYEGDYTKPFTYILGCEVTSLAIIPAGFRVVNIPVQSYRLFEARGSYPFSLIDTWQTIWGTPLSRSYTFDLERYPATFDPSGTPPIDIFIAVQH